LTPPTIGASLKNKKPDAKTRPEPGAKMRPEIRISRTRKRNSTGKSRTRNRDSFLDLGVEGWGFAGRKISLPQPDNTNPHSPLGGRSTCLPPAPGIEFGRYPTVTKTRHVNLRLGRRTQHWIRNVRTPRSGCKIHNEKHLEPPTFRGSLMNIAQTVILRVCWQEEQYDRHAPRP
jgi:hypothetical protein